MCFTALRYINPAATFQLHFLILLASRREQLTLRAFSNVVRKIS